MIDVVTETGDGIEFNHVNLKNLALPDPTLKPMAYMIGFSPFEKVGDNYTAKCKPKITRKDFKFLIFNATTETFNERFQWNRPIGLEEGAFDATNLINKTIWEESCNEKLEDWNYILEQNKGRPITEYGNALMVAINEFVLILQANYNQEFTDMEKLVFRDGLQYNSTDGVLYTNFENIALPDDQKMYQVPDSAFSSSAIKNSSGMAVIMMILCHIGF